MTCDLNQKQNRNVTPKTTPKNRKKHCELENNANPAKTTLVTVEIHNLTLRKQQWCDNGVENHCGRQKTTANSSKTVDLVETL
jgi:hypothetical protein